ncbi:dihydrolipoamide s-acetyltransferase of the pyruvate dehydrogenase [Micromonas commoda]|uniref:Dihydrolipoamide acetyltransferase component of pyruvate dehydrogenase complex n=1 Tax=Micromonas commoda (strain RCC299 / NOUM17 / CCMP2709) TaxID=296587 RepID=C1FH79_MICCC|nr:dihydrolipoamide s-acetyltransferase of the pyruvate dehydrogenase [Micromonas commoda]ACO69777.1 dihydrolipoamide s-acetyltransferase of the pyruvate dehydrogenase [Micromonas commoda]|eukprot:XP_002508519.1 dihydrolipoamide s-acetyltransferase of the pyruvate dehydrogenase [Micromonas commoda]
MPALSPTMTQGNIAEWKIAAGDKVNAGDVIADIETDKATMALESMEDGYVAKILVPAGATDVKVGELVAIMVDEENDCAKFADFTPGAAAPAAAAAPRAAPSGSRVFASPKARAMAEAAGVAIERIAGTGPNGRVVMADVQTAIRDGVPSATVASATSGDTSAGFAKFFPPFEDVSVSTIKKVTAQRLTESKRTVPHFYLSVDVRMDRLMAMRSSLNGALQSDGGSKISVNDFVVKASALSLKKVPDVNASWMGDKIRRYQKADISVAVQTDLGLMVPVVRGACGLGLSGISGEVRLLAGKAKDGKLSATDMIGGTFTISNLGMFGIKQFAAIVNPPQAAILAVGAARKEVVKKADGSGYEEALMMSATLSCDHRVVDGAVGAQWLGAFKSYMEDPVTMLL